MPFDGTYFPATTPYDTGLFPLWSRHGCRLWFHTRLRGKKAALTMLRAPSPAERNLAVADLLRDAKDMIADPKDWSPAHLPVVWRAALCRRRVAGRGKAPKRPGSRRRRASFGEWPARVALPMSRR